MNGQIELAWGDGDHTFNVAKLAQVFELEDKCGCGVMEVFTRIRESRWKFADIREVIRLGLIGAGMDPPKALLLVKRYVDDRPWGESVPVAMAILMAAIVGVEGDQPAKKTDADRGEHSTTPTGASSDPRSMASAPDLGGDQAKPEKRRSGSSPPASMDTTAPKAGTISPTRQPATNSNPSSNSTPNS